MVGEGGKNLSRYSTPPPGSLNEHSSMFYNCDQPTILKVKHKLLKVKHNVLTCHMANKYVCVYLCVNLCVHAYVYIIHAFLKWLIKIG